MASATGLLARSVLLHFIVKRSKFEDFETSYHFFMVSITRIQSVLNATVMVKMVKRVRARCPKTGAHDSHWRGTCGLPEGSAIWKDGML